MDIYLLDSSFDIIAIVDDFSSLIWRRKYYECGDFELHCSHTLFRTIAGEAKYVYRPDRQEVGTIENYGLTHPVAFCKGRFLESILSDRIIWPPTPIKNMAHGHAALTLVMALMPDIECSLDGYTIGSNIDTQVTGENLMEYLYSMLRTTEASYSVTCDLREKRLTFDVWQGVDRRTIAIFSPEWDNLIGVTYEYSNKDYRNYAVVAGQGEGSDRVSVIVDKTDGAARRELFVDARDLQQEEDESLDDYKARLTRRGEEKLSEYAVVEKCDTQIDTESNLKYMVDFDLGDLCTVTESEHGITCEKRITECEEVYENGAFSLSVTFGEGYLILPKYMERKLK